jgi:hypothetical protein
LATAAERDGDESEALEYQLNISSIIELFCGDIRQTGSADDYHNCAVEMARNKDTRSACLVLDEGLTRFPGSIDLLSDYLEYGIKCGELEKCKIYYQKLKSISWTSWNWRSFDFSIDYLEDLLEQTTDETRTQLAQEIMDTIDKMFEYIPNKEFAYFAKANYYDVVIKNDAERIKVLLSAMQNSTIRAPRCALCLAEYYLGIKDYNSAMLYVSRAKKDNVSDQPSVNNGYLYLISMLSKVSKLYDDSTNLELIDYDYEPVVKEIFEEYDVARTKLGKNDRRVKNAFDFIKAIEIKTKIHYSDYEYQNE